MQFLRKRRTLSVLILLTFLLILTCTSAQGAILSMGSRGERVALIQQRLKEWGYYTSDVDGVFGRGTYNAVVRFQRKNGLSVDGQVGKKTAAAMGVKAGQRRSAGRALHRAGRRGGSGAQPGPQR